MPREIYFITHPDVLIDPSIPVPQWPLSPRGREQMKRLLARDWVAQLESVRIERLRAMWKRTGLVRYVHGKTEWN